MLSRHTLATVTFFLSISFTNVLQAVEITGGTEWDRERMQEISKAWLDAYSSGDLDGIMAIMHADAIVMPHNQPTSRGTEEVRAYFATRIGRP